MRLLVIGYSYPGLVEGLRRLGHTVTHGDEHAAYLWWQQRRTPADYGAHLVVQAAQHDAIIIGKGWYFDELGFWSFPSEAIEECARRGCRMIYWSHDDPYSVREFLSRQLHRGFCAILTCCEGSVPQYMAGTRRLGVKSVRCVWPGWDTVNWEKWSAATIPGIGPTHLYGESQDHEKVDFTLVGSPYSDRMPVDFPRSQAALYVASRGLSMHLYGGPAWCQPVTDQVVTGHIDLKPYWRGPINWGWQWHAYAAAKINWVNFGAVGHRYINDRLPMVGGVGAFTLLDDRCGLGHDFIDQKEVVYYHGWEDWKQKFEWYLARPDERYRIGAEFRKKILARHTYFHRAAEIDQILKGL